MKKIILLSSLAITTVLNANDTTSNTDKNSIVQEAYASFNSVNYWMGDGSVDTNIKIDTTSFKLISAGVKFSPSLMNLSLSYETTLAGDSNNINNTGGEDIGTPNDFKYTNISIKPFAALGNKKIELGYENLKTATVGHLVNSSNNEFYYQGKKVTTNAIKDVPLNYDIKDMSFKYYFGDGEDPSKWYIGYRQVDSTQPYIDNTRSDPIRLDEEFTSRQLLIGMFKDFKDLETGLNMKEFRFADGPTTVNTKYDKLSNTPHEVDWSMNIYFEPAIKFSDTNSNLYLSAYCGYDVIWFSDDEKKGEGQVVSETIKYGFKIYYTF